VCDDRERPWVATCNVLARLGQQVRGKAGAKLTTSVEKEVVDPLWNFEARVAEYVAGDSLLFSVWVNSTLMCRASLDSSRFLPAGFQGELQLDPVDSGKGAKDGCAAPVSSGTLQVKVAAPPTDLGRHHSNLAIRRRLWGNEVLPECHRLVVTIQSATGLRNMDWLPGEGRLQGKSDPYCTCEVVGNIESRFKTQIIEDCLEPVWNRREEIENYQHGDSLLFTVWDQDWMYKTDDFLGMATLQNDQFWPNGFEGELSLNDSEKHLMGKLKVKVVPAYEGPVSITGFNVRKKLWSKYHKVAQANPDSVTGFGIRKKIRRPYKDMWAVYQRKKRQAKVALIEMTAPYRAQVMFATRESVKGALIDDPDLPVAWRKKFRRLVDDIWQDVLMEVEIAVEEAKMGVAGQSYHDVLSLREVGTTPPCCSLLAFRALVLYHFLPFDRSLFGCLRDPIFWILFILSVIPLIRVIFYALLLALLLLPGPPDEFQLLQYIMMFKGTQFMSGGVMMALIGGIQYYDCVHDKGRHTCAETGPGTSFGFVMGVIDFFGSCVLVWVGFVVLPYSVKSAGLRKTVDHEETEPRNEEEDTDSEHEGMSTKRCCGWHQYIGRGGRLRSLLRYDLVCFIISVGILVTLEGIRYCEMQADGAHEGGGIIAYVESWQFRSTLHWVRVIYSFFALPFMVLNIPVFRAILTHTIPTGYNRKGSIVAYLLPPVEDAEDEGLEGEKGAGKVDEELPTKSSRQSRRKTRDEEHVTGPAILV